MYTPHTVVFFLNTKGGLWLSDSWLWKYQALLLEDPSVQITTCPTLNPASFLSEEDKEPLNECEQVLLQTYAAREDLKEIPLDNPDLVLFINGSSYVQQGPERQNMQSSPKMKLLKISPLSQEPVHSWQN